MRALVLYESMYGNTHLVANAIGDGLREFHETEVMSIHHVNSDVVHRADLLVVGAPTHTHGMSHVDTRETAAEAVTKPDSDLTLDPDATGDGVREWFASLEALESFEPLTSRAAAFDTRVDIAPMLSGRASKGIAKHLRRLGCEMLADPESFFVTKDAHLAPDEESRARAWGRALTAEPK